MAEQRQVTVRRMELPAPDLEDPERKIVQVQYQVGELPPRFLYINKKDWSKEEEAKRIKEDIEKRLQPPGETITV